MIINQILGKLLQTTYLIASSVRRSELKHVQSIPPSDSTFKRHTFVDARFLSEKGLFSCSGLQQKLYIHCITTGSQNSKDPVTIFKMTHFMSRRTEPRRSSLSLHALILVCIKIETVTNLRNNSVTVLR